MDGVSPSVFNSIPNLKQRNGDLKALISVGGWSFNNPGTWQGVFSSLVSTESNRAKFIQNLLGFLSQYGFDGVDFDWDYPGADERGGNGGDTVNYVALLKELRIAVGADAHDYIVTATAPMSYHYLQNFDLAKMASYADWINFGMRPLFEIIYNLTEVGFALDLAWRAGVDPSQIVMGLGLYGRSFKITDGFCSHPGCQFASLGDPGPCTGLSGILSLQEVYDVLDRNGAQPIYDHEAAVNYIVDSSMNWIS
ncbi:glycoside hydrolase family 18 protein [Xylona heveae TC161]|uniref:chitinase n=1 Tax=Xylona heveae (strain CBS 132557 / TC161) TaxID=1328760 RepID=A0A165FBG1_XYLHT|nr:glycoside hydrolase family 18 protein [Xylona heveae TC161]KZF20786.1 glycoside hydrolase family 18 protein [Xylona heveae TC161]